MINKNIQRDLFFSTELNKIPDLNIDLIYIMQFTIRSYN